MDIDEIAEERMEFSMQFYVNEYWRDPRLNLSSFELKSQIPRDLFDDIWTPDTIFVNSKHGWVYQLSIPNIIIQMHKFRYLHRFTRYNMKISCTMYLRSFPMDTQICFLNITSLVNDDTRMVYRWLREREEGNDGIPDLYVEDIHPLKYSLEAAETISFELKWTIATFTGVGAKFKFVRHIGSHIFNVYIPSALIVVLSFLSFWLNVKAVPARVALGLTSLLTLSTQASQARAHLPPINYLTALDAWLFSCILQVFLSLLEYAFVYHTYIMKIQKQKSVSSKAWANVRLNSVPSPTQAIKKMDLEQKQLYKDKTTQSNPSTPEFEEETQSLDRISRVLFPGCFISFSVIYWIVYLGITV